MSALTKDNSRTIGFVGWCFLSNAISVTELNEWAESIMVSDEPYPDYIVDLREFDGSRFHFHRVVGFVSDYDPSEIEIKAFSGIAYLRGREVIDGPSRDQAIGALSQCPGLVSEFESTFAFLALRIPS